MKNQIRETLEKDIAEMLDLLSQNPHWNNGNRDSFEYEFMVDADGKLMYETWRHSFDEELVKMERSPLFKGLKDMQYTGVCYVRFHNHGTLISGDITDDDEYILEVVLTNSSFHSPAPYFLSEEDDGEVSIVFLADDEPPADDRYFFPLSKDWKVKQKENQTQED
jgi:hypothetical protein